MPYHIQTITALVDQSGGQIMGLGRGTSRSTHYYIKTDVPRSASDAYCKTKLEIITRPNNFNNTTGNCNHGESALDWYAMPSNSMRRPNSDVHARRQRIHRSSYHRYLAAAWVSVIISDCHHLGWIELTLVALVRYETVVTVRSEEKGQKILDAHPNTPKEKLSYVIVKDVAEEGAFDEVSAIFHPFAPLGNSSAKASYRSGCQI